MFDDALTMTFSYFLMELPLKTKKQKKVKMTGKTGKKKKEMYYTEDFHFVSLFFVFVFFHILKVGSANVIL